METLLLKIVYHLFILRIYVGLSFVKAQNLQIQIQPSTVILGQNDLVVTCSTTNPSQIDTVYAMELLKNNSDTMYRVVSVRSSNGQDTFTWWDTVLQTRASVTGTVSSPATANIKLTIPKDRVLCPRDFTGYKCTMSVFTTALINQESNQVYVTYTVYPTTIDMPTVRIFGEFSNTPSRQFPVGAAVQLTCTGQIGSEPSATIRWCSKKSQDFSFTGLPQTPIHSEVTLSGCQYTRSSIIPYNLTSDDTYTQFLCESGYSGLCETGTAKQYLNISLERSFISTHRLPQCLSTTENLSIIFGSLFGVFFCICAGLIIYIFHFKFSTKPRNNVEKNGKNGDYVTQNVSDLDEHKYHGFDIDITKTGHQENSAHYEVLGGRDPGNVYDRVKDANTGVVTQSNKDKQ